MRTIKEIKQRIKEVETSGHDFMGTETTDLIVCLSYAEAKEFLKDDITKELFEEKYMQKLDRESVLATMLDYMPFAWDKANNQRGLSASRSMSHFTSWVWLAGDDLGNLHDYEFYGKDNLIKICEHYGWDYSQWDDGERVN